GGTPGPASEVCCANLSELADGSWCKVASGKIAIDPELGRIEFASDVSLPQSLRVNYFCGFPAEIGGGPYDRSASLSQLQPAPQVVALVGSATFPTLEAAVQQWNLEPPGSSWRIVLPNLESFAIDVTGLNAIQIAPESNLSIVAGQPLLEAGRLDFTWSNSRVTLTGNVEVVGLSSATLPGGTTAPPGQLVISGIWLAGQLA